jgi:hypothetical protein
LIYFDKKRIPFPVAGIRQNLYLFEHVPQLVFLKVPWLTLAPFWLPFGSMLVVLVRFGMHFGSLWASFGDHSRDFRSLCGQFWFVWHLFNFILGTCSLSTPFSVETL